MRTLAPITLLIVILLAFVGCSDDRMTSPALAPDQDGSEALDQGIEALARDLVEVSQWRFDPTFADSESPAKLSDSSGLPRILDHDRELVVGDVYHYSWRLAVGPGPYDQILLHRVVEEHAPCRPVRSRKSVFMLHGDFKTFAGCFMPGYLSDHAAPDFGIAVHVAQEGLDVWGMDQAHNLIPAGTTNFASLADWDMFKYVEDTRTGLGIARAVRLFTGNGLHKMGLLGYSGGATLGFAVVNEESKLPRGFRHVGAFIPVDQGVIAGDPDFAASDCATAQYYADLIDSGEYLEANPFPLFGEPARDDPDGPSDLIPGFTNLEAALAVAVYPYVEGFPYHFLAGEFDANGLPSGLQYTDVDLWVDFLVQAPPFFANAFSRDEYISSCGLEHAPWADHLGSVDLPVLFVAAAGGFGEVYGATLDLLSSADVSRLEAQLHPPSEIELDFAHIDLFTAENAPELVWRPILRWVKSLRGAASQDAPGRATGTS